MQLTMSILCSWARTDHPSALPSAPTGTPRGPDRKRLRRAGLSRRIRAQDVPARRGHGRHRAAHRPARTAQRPASWTSRSPAPTCDVSTRPSRDTSCTPRTSTARSGPPPDINGWPFLAIPSTRSTEDKDEEDEANEADAELETGPEPIKPKVDQDGLLLRVLNARSS
jgi:hypothetical protein